jgi:hypothetical protein
MSCVTEYLLESIADQYVGATSPRSSSSYVVAALYVARAGQFTNVAIVNATDTAPIIVPTIQRTILVSSALISDLTP